MQAMHKHNAAISSTGSCNESSVEKCEKSCRTMENYPMLQHGEKSALAGKDLQNT